MTWLSHTPENRFEMKSGQIAQVIVCHRNINKHSVLILKYAVFSVCVCRQWECKTDMDNAFRFGEISVYCEGYDYPDDPYVLKGSCGVSSACC